MSSLSTSVYWMYWPRCLVIRFVTPVSWFLSHCKLIGWPLFSTYSGIDKKTLMTTRFVEDSLTYFQFRWRILSFVDALHYLASKTLQAEVVWSNPALSFPAGLEISMYQSGKPSSNSSMYLAILNGKGVKRGWENSLGHSQIWQKLLGLSKISRSLAWCWEMGEGLTGASEIWVPIWCPRNRDGVEGLPR